jgi:MFS family permease
MLTPDRFLTASLALTGAFLGISICNSWAIPQMLAGPRMVGRWVGVQNFVGNLAGAVAPALTGFLLGRTHSYYWPFVITAIVAWIGGLSWWFVVGPLDEVDWVKVRGTFSVPAAAAQSSQP